MSEIDGYLYSILDSESGDVEDQLVDMAYEQNGNQLYVLFKGDTHIYRYDNVERMMDSRGWILLSKELASFKIDTFHSMSIHHGSDIELKWIFLDYSNLDESGHLTTKVNWNINIYGQSDEGIDIETWYDNPGWKQGFKQDNLVFFGDNMFSENQMKFQVISRNKNMFDILDIQEVDGYYYGLFRDNEKSDMEHKEHYVVFKCPYEDGTVDRLSYDIAIPHMYVTSDDLYSLYVVDRESGKLKLREISVPDTDPYVNRVFDIADMINDSIPDEDKDELNVSQVLMQSFITDTTNPISHIDIMSNRGFHRVTYERVPYEPYIQTKEDFVDKLTGGLRESVINAHETEQGMHVGVPYFDNISKKINQFKEGFSTFDLIPTEFGQTQDVGVIPTNVIEDGNDDVTDHRNDSIMVSTDILKTDGVALNKDSNPGFVTCAVSNPATQYDDDNVFVKSQSNPLIDGTEFYDYIYDQDGNELMNLYEIPFIYRINTNNTYDLYINVPTTMTKYLNRVAGTLEPNGTGLVMDDDTRERINISNERLSNNLDESTTRLQVFIDRKYISIGTVDMVEISGNSIPLQIYRDSANNGLYDSIALESRWNGELVEFNEPEKDINKVMLEFEVYGTDSQSIHISGKTLVHEEMNDSKYDFSTKQ